jgi:hypothetical protein
MSDKIPIWVVLLLAVVLWLVYQNSKNKSGAIFCNAVTPNPRTCATHCAVIIPKPIVPVALPKPIVPTVHPPIICKFNSPNRPSIPQPSGAQTVAGTIAGVALAPLGPIAAIPLFIRNLTECFCAVNKQYGATLAAGVRSGAICPHFPTPASRAAQLRLCLHATSGVRRAALGCAL